MFKVGDRINFVWDRQLAVGTIVRVGKTSLRVNRDGGHPVSSRYKYNCLVDPNAARKCAE